MIDFNRNKIIDITSLILRIGFGSFIAFGYGLDKLLTLINGEEIMFVSFLGIPPVIGMIIAIVTELVGGISLIIGYKTRIVSLFLIFTMLIAILGIHINDPFFLIYAEGTRTIEFAFIYLLAFTFIFFLGQGKYSLERWIARKKIY